ncbi:MAG: exodeoxyribonuclease III, partial [bacterium]
MRIISYNVNGIRAAIKKGFIDWLKTDPADIVCVQETKATKEDIDVTAIQELGYHDYWFSASSKKGYSGVAVFTKIKPDKVITGNGHAQSDDEGRVIQLEFGDLLLINAYFPSGTSGDERQAYKMVWLDELMPYLKKIRKKYSGVILCGDYNIAHNEIDIHDPKGNKKSSGFLPEERAWLDEFFKSGWIDTFRSIHPEPHRYSWWSQRFPSVRLNN